MSKSSKIALLGSAELTKIVRKYILYKVKSPFLYLIRSDRVAVLRQKYEAFLEDDKKRKERNEYILSRLDKMRSCTAVVAHNNKPHTLDEIAGVLYNNRVHLSLPAKAPPFTMQYRTIYNEPVQPKGPTNDNSIIAEIIKKFILIPKRITETEPEPSPSIEVRPNPDAGDHVNNPDWKSKYDILQRLKSEEKESVRDNDACAPTKETAELSDERTLKILKKYAQPEHTIIPSQDLPEKDISDIINQEHGQKQDLYDDYSDKMEKITDPITDPEKEIEIKPSFDNLGISGEKIEKPRKPSDKEQQPVKPQPPPTLENNVDEVQEVTEDLGINRDRTDNLKSREKVEYIDDDGFNPVQISYPDELVVDKPLGDVPKDTEDMQYPMEAFNVESFTPSQQQAGYSTYQPVVETNPQGYDDLNQNYSQSYADEQLGEQDNQQVLYNENKMTQEAENIPQPTSQNTEDVSNPAEDTGAESIQQAMEYEIKDMFYQETPDQAMYGEHAVGDGYQTQNVNYNEADQYQTNQYYYEGPHEEEGSVYINEHEETSQVYDPNYAQQYSNAYTEEYQKNAQELPPSGEAEPHVEQPVQEYDPNQQYEEGYSAPNQQATEFEQQEYDQTYAETYDPNLQYQELEHPGQYDANITSGEPIQGNLQYKEMENPGQYDANIGLEQNPGGQAAIELQPELGNNVQIESKDAVTIEPDSK